MEKTDKLRQAIVNLEEAGIKADMANLARLREDLMVNEINLAKLESKMAEIRLSILKNPGQDQSCGREAGLLKAGRNPKAEKEVDTQRRLLAAI